MGQVLPPRRLPARARTIHNTLGYWRSFIYVRSINFYVTCPRLQTVFIAAHGTDKRYQIKWKKRSETQTLLAGCSKAVPKNFAPPQTPFPGAQDGQNLIADGHYFYLQTQLGEDRCMQIWVIVVTDPQTNKPTNTQTNAHTGPITIYCAAKLSTQCNNKRKAKEQRNRSDTDGYYKNLNNSFT